MKYLIIGLGNFGTTLALELTAAGHEVMGVDISERFVDNIKDKIESAVIMDATDIHSINMLPLDEIDICVIAIGKDLGTSIKCTVALQQREIKNIWARAFDLTHKSILKALGIKNILMPEADAASFYVKTIITKSKTT